MFFRDEDIIKGIRDKRRDVLKYVYSQYFDMIKWRLVYGKTFSEEDAKDIFQDALIAIYKNIMKEDFSIQCSFKTYIFSVVKNMLLLRLKIGARMEMLGSFNFEEVGVDNPNVHSTDRIVWDEGMLTEMKWGLLWKKFKELPDDCRDILRMFYCGTSLKEIAGIKGYKSENYAKKRKHSCKEYLKKIIEKDVLYVQIKDHDLNG